MCDACSCEEGRAGGCGVSSLCTDTRKNQVSGVTEESTETISEPGNIAACGGACAMFALRVLHPHGAGHDTSISSSNPPNAKDSI